MFFKQVWRNARRNRKNNGLFFGSLVIAIIAFYTLLSLQEQDVMRFLSEIESHAVAKLLRLIPMIYILSLFFVFFLVYFTCKYQTDSRSREFGMYLMLGMKQSRLFAMLFCETLSNSLISLIIGLPMALFLTEGISLATAKLIGLGIVGHHISFSFKALAYTICGFILVQLISVFIICAGLANTEPAAFMRSDFAKEQKRAFWGNGIFFFLAGVLFLSMAYITGIFFLNTFRFQVVFMIFVLGIFGTFLLYRGLGAVMGKTIEKQSRYKAGLTVFTARQLQENVLCQHKSLAVSSLLLLMSLACISFGVGTASGNAEERTTDLSVKGSEADIQSFLADGEISSMVEASYPVYISRSDLAKELTPLENAVKMLPESSLRDNIIENIPGSCEYLIAESGFNLLMTAMGKEPLSLDKDQMALFSSDPSGDFTDIMNQALSQEVSIGVNGTQYTLLPRMYCENIVADRMISLYMALIVPDEVFLQAARDTEPFCYNLHLSKEFTKEKGLLNALTDMGGILRSRGLEYDSYLGGIGRNLFYTVASSYLTLYLGILFLLISNTVIGLKYLIWQRQNKQRYITLMMLGADVKALCRSAKSQILTFFNLVLSIAVINGIFAILSMFGSFLRLPPTASLKLASIMSVSAFLMFILTEFVYVSLVKRAACSEIMELKLSKGRNEP